MGDVVQLTLFDDDDDDDDDDETETCDLCRDDWPVDDLASVEWTDTAGETWERRFCSDCREREGLD